MERACQKIEKEIKVNPNHLFSVPAPSNCSTSKLVIFNRWQRDVLSHSVVSYFLWPRGLYPIRLLCPWNSPGKNTGVGCHALLQGIFPTQGSNPGLSHCKQILFFFSFIFISWRLITLQYCSGFCHTLTWISHGFTCVPHPEPLSHLPPHRITLGLPSAPALSTCLMHPTWAGDLFHTW